MSDAKGPSPEIKKRSLVDLLPDKKAVETSIGTLFVRHVKVSDLETLDVDEQALGKTLVRQLCSRAQDKRDTSALPEEDFIALTEEDFGVLAPAIAERNNWKGLAAGAGLVELGSAAKIGLDADRAGMAKMNADLHASIKSKYPFLDQSVLGKLQTQMADLNKLGVLGRSVAEAQKWASKDLGIMSALTSGIKADPMGFAAPRIDASSIRIPRPEESKLGRATLASAEYSKQSSEKIDALVQVVAGLNQTVVSEILPAWTAKFAADQDAGKTAFEQAAQGLRWTRRAVYVSVIVTALATVWQVWVAYAIDGGNAGQQKRVEDALREQIATQQTMIEQQAREGAMLRDALRALTASLGAKPVDGPKQSSRHKP